MKKILTISVCFVTVIALFASCSTTEDEVSTTRTRMQSNSFSDSETTIPLDRALKSLDDFIKKNYPITKGTSFSEIESISNYCSSGQRTKSSNESTPDAYIINYKNNSGFAILGAKSNLPDVIAVVESGTIDTTTLVVTFNRFNESKISQCNEDPDDPMPDSIGFYCEDDNDFYCEVIPLTDTSRFVGEMIRNGTNPENGNIGSSAGSWFNENEGGSSGSGSSNDNGNNSSGKPSSNTTTSCSPLLTYSWNQDSPYNDYCYRKNLVGKRKKALTGCSNTALSMLIAYNEYPANYYANGTKINWSLLKSVEKINKTDNTDLRQQVALLMASNFYNVTKIATKSFTLITPEQIKKRMSRIGYTNTKKLIGGNLTNEMKSETKRMLDNKLPVFISAIPKKWKHGHSWIIDGYSYSNDNTLLLHFNFGWGGIANGYFSVNCLNPGKAVSYDDQSLANEAKNKHNYTYSWHFRLITYNKGDTENYSYSF